MIFGEISSVILNNVISSVNVSIALGILVIIFFKDAFMIR